MNKKAILAGTVFAGAVATPIALTINSAATAYETNPYAVMLSTAAPFKTLNKFKVPSTADSDKVLGMFTCGLFRAKPQGKNNGGLDTALALQNLSVGAGQPDPGA